LTSCCRCQKYKVDEDRGEPGTELPLVPPAEGGAAVADHPAAEMLPAEPEALIGLPKPISVPDEKCKFLTIVLPLWARSSAPVDIKKSCLP